MNTTENNKIIAEFMSVESNGIVFQDENTKEFHPIKYHSDWNWLMEVVEKIESIVSQFAIKTYTLANTYTDVTIIIDKDNIILIDLQTSKIEAVYNACIEFIKWYNENYR